MSSDLPAEHWPVLDAQEQRVLGVLIEKQKTTPDAYPLSMNSMVTGCNQKSNRDPVTHFEDLDVEAALNGLKEKSLVIRVQGAGRVERWRHNVYDTWHVDKVEVAVLADLLLRGAQTEGELRSHVSRMEPVDDLETLRGILQKLADRKLVIYLTPPGQRGSRLTHGFHAPGELQYLRASAAGEPASGGPSVSVHRPAPARSEQAVALEQALTEAQRDIATLRGQMSEMEASLAAMRQELQTLKQALGG